MRILVAAILAAIAVRLVALIWLHPLNWDEIEFFRATDWVRQGLVPYRDFWEHHTPLQWFLFAPFTTLTKSPGADAVIFMRGAQVLLWVVTFWLANRLMARLGIGQFARWATMAIAVCSQLLMIAAVEYRVDVLGCAMYLAGLVFLVEDRRSRLSSFLAGIAFCLAGLANLRLGPLLALTVLLNRIINPREKKWGGTKEANWVFAGVIAALAAAIGYFAATSSLRPLYQHVWVENYLGDKFAERVPLAFLHRILVPLGIRIYGGRAFELSGVDLAGAAILVLGVIGMIRALREWRAPGETFFLAFLQLSNLLFISVMKFVYHYHLEIVVLLMLPFVAMEIERLQRERLVVAFVIIVSVLNAAIVLLRGKEIDLQYQDLIMREAHAHTAPGSKVFDGVGWALRRKPAYYFWFLPELPRKLVEYRYAKNYTLADWRRDPPAAVITDRNAAVWLAINQVPLGAYVVHHYMPLWRNLWLPGMSARVDGPFEWAVPFDGAYRVISLRSLARHPWFDHPLAYAIAKPEIDLGSPRSDVEMEWVLNGQPVVPENGVLKLQKDDSLIAIAREPVGVFLVRDEDRLWFRQPPPGVTLDSEAARVTHIPTFRRVFGE